jgi:hypothetical protein
MNVAFPKSQKINLEHISFPPLPLQNPPTRSLYQLPPPYHSQYPQYIQNYNPKINISPDFQKDTLQEYKLIIGSENYQQYSPGPYQEFYNYPHLTETVSSSRPREEKVKETERNLEKKMLKEL